MTHPDHVRLIQKAVTPGIWADFGSGEGAFTLALRDAGGDEIKIYSVDKDAQKLQKQAILFNIFFPDSHVHYLHEDIAKPLDLPLLDGIVMANVLHYFVDPVQILKQISGYLKEKGKLIVIEYNADKGNVWVPYPISFERLKTIAPDAGLSDPEFLDKEPSQFLKEIYSAVLLKQ
jgi:SAM-dependent methyltransferase